MEGRDCKIYIDRICLEDVSEFKYLGCFLNESSTDEAESSMKVESGRRVAELCY